MKSCIDNIRPGNRVITKAPSGNKYLYLVVLKGGSLFAQFFKYHEIIDRHSMMSDPKGGAIDLADGRIVNHRIITIFK